MYDIVLATDGNEDRARSQAAAVASLPGDKDELAVTVLHVFREFKSDEWREIDMQEYSNVPEAVAVAVEYLEERGIEVEPKAVSGDPAEEIVRVARELGADQIVVGVRKRSPVGKAVFGSVSQDVILSADQPVLVVGETVEEPEEESDEESAEATDEV